MGCENLLPGRNVTAILRKMLCIFNCYSTLNMAVRNSVERQHKFLQTARRHATQESDLKLISNCVNFVRNKLAKKYPAILKPECSAFCSRILACRPRADAAEKIRYPQSSFLKIFHFTFVQIGSLKCDLVK